MMVMFNNFSLYKTSINILTILFSSTYPPPIKHGLLKTPPFVDDFHIYKGFPFATCDYRRAIDDLTPDKGMNK